MDSSGLRFTTTSRLRQYDAGIITAGMIVSGVEHLIPPNAESFLSYGDCTESCLRQVSRLLGVGLRLGKDIHKLQFLLKDF